MSLLEIENSGRLPLPSRKQNPRPCGGRGGISACAKANPVHRRPKSGSGQVHVGPMAVMGLLPGKAVETLGWTLSRGFTVARSCT